MKAEMIYDLDFKQYRSRTNFVSVSELKLFADSPYSYKQKYLDKAQPEIYKPSGDQEFGTLCHCILLEPKIFDSQYFISDVRKDERTKAYQEIKAQAGEKIILSPAEYERSLNVVEATKKEMRNEGLDFSDLKTEASIFVEKNKLFPLPVKGRYDLYDHNKEIIFDYKTTKLTPDHETIEKHILNFRYYWQAAFYCDLHKAVTGRKPKDFVWIFQQTVFPYACAVYWTNQEMIDIGRLEYREKLQELRDCLKGNDFPVLRRQPRYISLPRFYVSKYITNCDAKDMKKGEIENGI